MKFVVGIDGGGTGCRAALATAAGQIVGRGKAGPANIRTDLSRARENIVDAATQAFKEAGHDPALITSTGAVLGLAGTNVGTYAQQLETILPFAQSRVVNDALIALDGAVGEGRDGAIAILGTGTAYLVRRNGKARAVGGWGFQVGDQGSGGRIGRDLLEETLLAHDGIRPASPLTAEILAVFRGDPQDVVEFTINASPGDYGGFAPKVFEYASRGDPVAEMILARAVAAVEASLAALDLDEGMPLCLLGGLAPLHAKRLSPRYQALLREPRTDALGGAVAMAARLFGGTERADV
ncbi:BadF/BadG/BcrA/BcrD ATPase family protein [Mesorhizobium sp. ZMM04-5]|uniref:BadF/BadG/BcrA/BcrD ATPase family protein n=1 Tax=Mesorhizobium marinum TaxID=3228790 RepID=A0ABV3R334_9HYPH